MNGADIADQQTASYYPDIRCRRAWMLLKMQCIHILRNNAFVVDRELVGNSSMSQKEFLMGFCASLKRRGVVSSSSLTSNMATETSNLPSRNVPVRRRRMSENHPSLPQCRLEGPAGQHVAVI